MKFHLTIILRCLQGKTVGNIHGKMSTRVSLRNFQYFFCDKKTFIYRCRLFSYMSRNVPVRRRSWSPLDLQKINSIEDKRYEKNELTWDERCLEWRRFKRNVKTKFKVSSKFMNCNETLTVSNTKTPLQFVVKYLFWACWTIENNVSLGHFYFMLVFPYIFHFSSRRICYLLWLWNKEQRRRKSEARHKRQRFYPSRNTRCETRCTPSSAQSRNR